LSTSIPSMIQPESDICVNTNSIISSTRNSNCVSHNSDPHLQSGSGSGSDVNVHVHVDMDMDDHVHVHTPSYVEHTANVIQQLFRFQNQRQTQT
jgi:hypothetical protein